MQTESNALVKARIEALQKVPSRLISRGLEDITIFTLDEIVRRLVDSNPNDAEGYCYRGLAYHLNGEFEHALSDYNQALRLNPGYTDAYYHRGIIYHIKKEYNSAITDFDQVLRLNPSYTGAYFGRGLAHCKKDNYDFAIIDFSHAIRLDPDSAPFYHYRGLAYNLKGELEKSIADSNTAIRLDREYAPAYGARATAYRGQGKYDLAINDLSEALRIDPNSAPAFLNLGITLNSRGHSSLSQGNYDSAIADFKRAISVNPNNATSYLGLGFANALKRNIIEARVALKRAIELGSPEARELLDKLPQDEPELTVRTPTSTQPPSGGCFIVTATYGSPLASEVQIFRDYRDQKLVKTATGRKLIGIYNAIGPLFAEIISHSNKLRSISRFILGFLVKRINTK